MELKDKDYPASAKSIFNLLTIRGKYSVIGSAKLKGVKYSADYDLQEFIESSDPSFLLHLFQKKFELAEQNPNIFITDFKCGEIKGVPIRWNKTTIQAGKQKIGRRMVTFEQCLLMKSIIKMDIIALLGNVFVEFSENYYIKLGTFTNYQILTKTAIQQSILKDAKEYAKKGDYFKSLKRIFAFLNLKKGHLSEKKQLLDFFNSSVGFLNKQKNELQILSTLIENPFRKPQREDILNNLRMIQQNMNSITDKGLKTNLYESMDLLGHGKRNMKELKHGIDLLTRFLEEKISIATLAFLEENKISKYIK